MSDRGLTLSQVEQVAVDAAKLCGLAIQSAERNGLRITFHAGQHFPAAAHRSKVAFWATGGGAFIVDFDDEWNWVVTDDETSADAEDSIRQIVEVADHYLRGEGQIVLIERRWHRPQRFLSFDIHGESIKLQESRPRRSAH